MRFCSKGTRFKIKTKNGELYDRPVLIDCVLHIRPDGIFILVSKNGFPCEERIGVDDILGGCQDWIEFDNEGATEFTDEEAKKIYQLWVLQKTKTYLFFGGIVKGFECFLKISSHNMVYSKVNINKYTGQVLKVHDGDTFEALIELGFGITQKFKVRLDGIDTPELSTEEGKAAKTFVQNLIEEKEVVFVDSGPEKYGRARAKIYMLDGTDLTKFLIEKGIGKEYHGGKKTPFSSMMPIE